MMIMETDRVKLIARPTKQLDERMHYRSKCGRASVTPLIPTINQKRK